MLIAVVVIPDPQRTVSGLPVCRGAARIPIIRGITLAYVITQVVAFQSGPTYTCQPAIWPVAVTVGVKGGISAVERIFPGVATFGQNIERH